MVFSFFVTIATGTVILLVGVFACNAGDTNILTLKQHVNKAEKDDYFCTSILLPAEEAYIIGYQPLMKASVVHHMLLYGCTGGVAQEHTWRCGGGIACPKGASQQILYAWALQADGLELPKDVGFKVGGNGISYVTMEIHYFNKPTISEDDDAVLKVLYTKVKQKYVAGIYLIGAKMTQGLPPGLTNYTLDAACTFKGPNPLHPFAYRTHTHSHGTAMYGYAVDTEGNWQLIGSRSPQDPQAFYPVNDTIVVNVGDTLAARTYYNMANEGEYVSFGWAGIDEMSRFYVMYYTLNNDKEMIANDCWYLAPPTLEYPYSDPVLPVHSAVTDHAHHHHHNHEHEDSATSQDSSSTPHFPIQPSSVCDTCTGGSTQAMNTVQSSSSRPPSSKDKDKQKQEYSSLFLILVLVGVAVLVVFVTVICCGFCFVWSMHIVVDTKQQHQQQRRGTVQDKKLRSLLKGPVGNGFAPITAHGDSGDEETTIFQQMII